MDTKTLKKTLPAKFYVDTENFQGELDRLFYRKWICVGREEQIAEPGSYFLRTVGRESIILTKDTDGKPRAFFNVCRHRGTQLCDKQQGTFKGRIQCPYHAWTWTLDGKLVGAPHFDEVEGFQMADYPLNQISVSTWDGHLWVKLVNEENASLEEQIGTMRDKFRNWRSEDLKLGKRIVYDVKANWKLIIQNYSECLHCPVIHPMLKNLTHYMSSDNEPWSFQVLGGSMTLNDGVETMVSSGKSGRAPFKHLTDHERRRIYYYWVAPNLLLSLHPDYLMTHTLWPKSPDRTEIVCEFHFHPDEMKKPGFNPEDAASFWDGVNREDWHVSELSQLGISSLAYKPGPYSNRESLLHGLDVLLTTGEHA